MENTVDSLRLKTRSSSNKEAIISSFKLWIVSLLCKWEARYSFVWYKWAINQKCVSSHWNEEGGRCCSLPHKGSRDRLKTEERKRKTSSHSEFSKISKVKKKQSGGLLQEIKSTWTNQQLSHVEIYVTYYSYLPQCCSYPLQKLNSFHINFHLHALSLRCLSLKTTSSYCYSLTTSSTKFILRPFLMIRAEIVSTTFSCAISAGTNAHKVFIVFSSQERRIWSPIGTI